MPIVVRIVALTGIIIAMIPAKNTLAQRAISPSDKYKSTFTGDGRASDGTFLALNGYETANGDEFSVIKGKFKSAEAAQRELTIKLESASRILANSPTN